MIHGKKVKGDPNVKLKIIDGEIHFLIDDFDWVLSDTLCRDLGDALFRLGYKMKEEK